MSAYFCTDEASGGHGVTIKAESVDAALAEYIADALRSPSSYNQGEDGIDSRINACAYATDDDSVRAFGVIDFNG